ncbi:MAG: Hsp70 family protein, partial [Betaproteobacteria bacterium]
GQFNLEGIPSAPRGMPQIEVGFDIDANGILHVSAKDKATGKENKIKITANSGLSDAEVQKMVKDAEVHAEEDKKLRELVEARNQADGLVHTAKKSLAEHGDKVEAAEKSAIEAAIKDTEDAIKSGDLAMVREKSEALAKVSQKLGEKMYAEQQAKADAASGAPGGGSGGASAAGGAKQADDGNVVDAEFTEVKDKKG